MAVLLVMDVLVHVKVVAKQVVKLDVQLLAKCVQAILVLIVIVVITVLVIMEVVLLDILHV